jgi:anthranilate phosphoribosyltransferase
MKKNTYLIYNKLIDNQDLAPEEAYQLANMLMADSFTPVQVAAILTALKTKGETVQEIRGFIKAMRERMIALPTHETAVDTCGTGGDGSNTFNISTTVAFVVAGAGVPVAKHGNRSATSKCGSSDCLDALGVNTGLISTHSSQVLISTNMVFLFAPLYHPSLKPLGPIRKELGFRTIFNYLGPFCNPAGVRRQLIGVPTKEVAEKMVEVARELGYHHLAIVCNEEGMDEIGLSGTTHVFELQNGLVSQKKITAQTYGFKEAKIAELRGGNAQENAAIIKAILKGEQGPKRDVVVLNAGYVLYISGAVKSVEEGIVKAMKSIDSGKAYKVLEKLIIETQKYAKS